MNDEQTILAYVTSQRWYGSKSREVTHATVLDVVQLPGGGAGSAVGKAAGARPAAGGASAPGPFEIALVEIRFREGTHDTYQLLSAEEIDGIADPAFARELVHLIRTGAPVQAREGVVEFHPVEGFAGLGRELSEARVVGSEQSNTSVIFDDELILKAYRRIEAGVNPELELLRFLTAREFPNIAPLGGWYAYAGAPLDATLGVLQQYVRNGVDGWELALQELADAPDRFLTRLRRLGQVTGAMHAVLGSEAEDTAFCPETPSIEALGLLTATVDEEIERVFVDLPDDVPALEPIFGRGEDVRERLRALTHAGSTGKVIRHHGDFHLGQTLWAEGDWVVLDFEGEPARSLPERRRKRSPLRDVAGMLRSFAYASSASELRGTAPPADWEERARTEFLEGYFETVDPTLLPPGREAIEKLLAVFELEKAVYELRYELNSRPDWVPIPVAGILRLVEDREPVAT